MRSRVLQGRKGRGGRGRGHGGDGGTVGKRGGNGRKGRERGTPGKGDTGKRRRNGETRGDTGGTGETGRNGPGHSEHPLTERRRARAVRPAESRGKTPETTPHRQDPIALSMSPSLPQPGRVIATHRGRRSGSGAAAGPGTQGRDGAGRDGPRETAAAARLSRDTTPPAAGSSQSQGSVSPASVRQPMGARCPSAPRPPLAVG